MSPKRSKPEDKEWPDALMARALEYGGMGWSIIPIAYGTKKKPTVRWKTYQVQRPDEAQLRNWFSANRRLNVAVVLGEVSGNLACRDFDTMEEYERWVQAHPDLAAKLPTVKTTRGRHVYFQAAVEGTKSVPNGELRGNGAYCLLPPPLHPSGNSYEWITQPTRDNLLYIDDPAAAGLYGLKGNDVTERAESTERIDENTRELTEIKSTASAERAIIRTLPSAYGTRHRRIFEFARTLKSMPQFSDANPADLRPLVVEWHKRALPYIRTKEFDETWTDFCLGWENVKYLLGEGPMAQIFERAKTAETPQIAVSLYPGNASLQLFVTLCYELQKEAGDEPFFLDCRTGASHFGVSPMTISRWFRTLEIDRVVALVQKGGLVEIPNKDGAARKEWRASRFKYIGQ